MACEKTRNGVTRKWRGSDWITKTRRLAIYLRDGFKCLACGRNLLDCPDSDRTLDHCKPHSQGGTHANSNLYTCCRSCNSRRKDQPLSLFLDEAAQSRVRNARRRSMNKPMAQARFIRKNATLKPIKKG